MNNILVAAIGMGGLGLFWAVILVIVNKKFHVEENPLIESVVACLPGANCGACGFAGCGAFGEAVVEEGVDPMGCPVNKEEAVEEIAKILGKELGQKGVKQVAKLHCTGSKENVSTIAEYSGHKSCIAEHVTNGGTKACQYGCLGHGDCVNVCGFGAMKMLENGLPFIDEEKCVSCGKCVEVCPRGLIKMVPIDQPVYILCSSKDAGVVTKKACKVGCIGCTICAKKVDENTFKIADFLATVDYEASKKMTPEQIEEAVQKCPQKIITKK
jgi:Na+-translocating ferredoxin:NAD+ oxidoreductase subunit B